MPYDPYFFGYGSLVNTATHVYSRHFPARLDGWRRVWRHTPFREMAFLTAEPYDGVYINGLIAAVPNADWIALDAREEGYDRVPVNTGISHSAEDAGDIAVYHIPVDKHGPADGARSILLSYLDVCVQGYLQVFGEDGGQHFFDTTAGWDVTPVLDDRAAPRYPRKQVLTAKETAFVDAQLDRLGVRFTDG
ncbi:gamma-glutamylcyclotransferase family protein [Pseudooceanicola sp. C21-150M6]|uniref:gamma-glutamylcyclotransferase family protein n=1 Tax=Pseudooceanicola sp. C21-150M6 TaxID=3434355 RepID=UPI003D7F3179